MSINIDFSFTEKFICIQSRISAGLSFTNFDIEPIYLDIDVENETLGKNIKEALSKSIDILDGNERVRISAYFLSKEYLEKKESIKKQKSKELKQKYGYKSLKELDRDYMYVGIYLIDNKYNFTPSFTKKDGAIGIEGVDNIIVSNDSLDVEIGIAVRQAMALCKSIYK